jgi:thiol-disulfide isomerase/thioredoxin
LLESSLSSAELKLDQFLLSKGIRLLSFPQDPNSLGPGRFYRGKRDDNDILRLNGIGSIGDILCHKDGELVSNFQLKDIKEGKTPESIIKGSIQSKSNLNLHVNFFEGLFDLIASGLGVKVSAKVDKEKVHTATYEFSGLSFKRLDILPFQNQLKEYIVSKEVKENLGRLFHYTAYWCHYCDKLKILFSGLAQSAIESVNSIKEIIDLGLKINTGEKNISYLEFNTKVCYGISLAYVDFSFYDRFDIKLEEELSENIEIISALRPIERELPQVIIS